MRRLLRFPYENAVVTIVALTLFTLGLGFVAWRVELDVSADQLLPRDSPLLEQYDRVRATFGSDSLAAVYVEDRDLFRIEKITLLRRLHDRLADLEGIERIESLFTVNRIKGKDGWLDVGPFLDPIPEDQASLDSLPREAAHNPLLSGRVISRDGTATLLTLYLSNSTRTGLSDTPDASAIQESDELAASREVFENIEEAIGEFESQFKIVFQIGSPALETGMSDLMLRDQRLLLPLSALLIAVLIGISLQNLLSAIVPILNAFVSTIWTLGIMVFLSIPLNMLNYVVPAIILVVGATEDIHLLVEYRGERRKGRTGLSAIIRTEQAVGLPLLLTACATIMGFAATGLTSIVVMQQFGITAAIGITCRFITTVTVLPAFLRLVLDRSPNRKAETRKESWISKQSVIFTDWIMRRLVTHPFAVVAVFVVIALPCLFFAIRIDLNNDLMAFLRPGTELLERIQTVSKKLSGPKVVYLTLKGEPGDFMENGRLGRLHELAGALRKIDEFDAVTALSDYLALVNREMHDGDPKYFAIPKDDNLIAQYLLLFHRSDIESFVNSDYSQANIVLRTSLSNSTEFNELVTRVRSLLDSGIFGPFVYTITGRSVLIASAVDKIVKGQVTSLTSITLFLFLVISVLFISVRCGILVVIANLFSIAVVFGIMGLLKIPLNVGTCMVAAITIGIGVDDTLHLMVRYNRNLKSLKNEHEAIRNSLRSEILPVSVTSLALAGGFLVLSFSSFVPVQQFGILSAVVLLIAVISDLILTPVLLSTVRLITLWDLIELPLRTALREKSLLFQEMSQLQVKQFILLSNMVEFEKGTQIIKEGDWGQEMYVVIEGELEVSRVEQGKPTPINTLSLGDAFGEIALVTKSRRTADIFAVTDTKLLSIDWDSLSTIRNTAPLLASKIYLNLARILGRHYVETLSHMKGSA